MSESPGLTEEIKTLITILRHQGFVRKYLRRLANNLEDRATVHDLSKLSQDEFAGFVDIQQVARTKKYGGKEYKNSLVHPAVISHWSKNSHHPEHYPNGIDDMSLLDIIEMVIDWKAASETYGQTSFEDGLDTQIDRFKLKPEYIYLVKLIAKEL